MRRTKRQLPLVDDDRQRCLEWWAEVMSALPFYVLLLDEDHRIVAFNHALRETFPHAELQGGYCPQVVHGTNGPYPGCPLEVAIGSGETEETEIWDEEKRAWFSSAIYPTQVCDAEQRPLYLHLSRDITEKKQAQLQLAQSLEHHMALGQLLQRLQQATREEDSIEAFADLSLGLSWLSAASGAVGFLVDGDELRLVSASRVSPTIRTDCARIKVGQCLCGEAARTGKVGFSTHHSDRDPDHSHATFPLVHEGRTLGVVTFYVREGLELEPHQVAFLRSAAQVTAASVAERMAHRAAQEAQERASVLERRLLERAIDSQEEERRRIARELHDDLGQGLSALLLDIQSAAQAPCPPPAQWQHLESSMRGLITQVYRLAWDLRPAVLDDFGLDSALSRYIAKLVERHGLPLDYDFLGPRDERLPPEVEVALYRLAQEALTNVVRHARAKRASVLVFRHPDSISLLVEDDGCGFDESQVLPGDDAHGLGLKGMRERAALLRGDLVVESSPGEGTSIRVTVPL